MNDQKPMPLKNLPQYLDSVRGTETGSAPVVDMGQIVDSSPTPRNSPYRKFLLPALMLFTMLLGFGAITTIDENNLNPQQYTVIVTTDNPYESMPNIMSDNSSEVISVRQIGQSTYKVEVYSQKNRYSLLRWLRSHRNVRDVELQN